VTRGPFFFADFRLPFGSGFTFKSRDTASLKSNGIGGIFLLSRGMACLLAIAAKVVPGRVVANPNGPTGFGSALARNLLTSIEGKIGARRYTITRIVDLVEIATFLNIVKFNDDAVARCCHLSPSKGDGL